MSHGPGLDAESVLRNPRTGVVVVDGTWRVRHANRAVESIAGCTRAAIIG
jgi:PAS domain-containing protein